MGDTAWQLVVTIGHILDKSPRVDKSELAALLRCQGFDLLVAADGDFIDEWPGGFFEESFHEKFAGR